MFPFKKFMSWLGGLLFWLAVGYFTDPAWTALVLVVILFGVYGSAYRLTEETISRQQKKLEETEQGLDRVYEKLLDRIEYLENRPRR
jgi:hypothetical protein